MEIVQFTPAESKELTDIFTQYLKRIFPPVAEEILACAYPPLLEFDPEYANNVRALEEQFKKPESIAGVQTRYEIKSVVGKTIGEVKYAVIRYQIVMDVTETMLSFINIEDKDAAEEIVHVLQTDDTLFEMIVSELAKQEEGKDMIVDREARKIYTQTELGTYAIKNPLYGKTWKFLDDVPIFEKVVPEAFRLHF